MLLQENTLLSFATAAAMGADFIEFDVMLTSDGYGVCAPVAGHVCAEARVCVRVRAWERDVT